MKVISNYFILKLIAIFILIFHHEELYSNDEIQLTLNNPIEFVDCESLAISYADSIHFYFQNNQINRIKEISAILQEKCGTTEWLNPKLFLEYVILLL